MHFNPKGFLYYLQKRESQYRPRKDRVPVRLLPLDSSPDPTLSWCGIARAFDDARHRINVLVILQIDFSPEEEPCY